MEIVNTSIAVITINVNALNFSIKRHRVVEWIKKNGPNYLLSTKNSLEI